MPSFSQKKLEARVTLAEGNFNAPRAARGEGGNTKLIQLGMDVNISKPGGAEKNRATIKVFNMPLEDMEVLTTLAFEPLSASRNSIEIYAGDEDGMTLAFAGDVVSAVPDFNVAPDPVFTLSCITGYLSSISAISPTTVRGETNVGELLAQFALSMGMAFVNNGAGVKLRNVALLGGPMEQARRLADMARLDMIVDDGELIVGPKGSLRDGGEAPLWSAETGMLGYPGFDNTGIVVRGMYEPRLKLGGPLRVESVVPRAGGLWRVTSLSHRLQANYPAGTAWESRVNAVSTAGGDL